MTSHPSKSAGNSQCAKILTVLKANRGRWVSLPHLVSISGGFAVHSRIADLRRRGCRIANQLRRHAGKVHSFYKIIKVAKA